MDESCLDAVVAGSMEPEPPDLTRKPGFGIASALLKVSHMGIEVGYLLYVLDSGSVLTG